MLQKRSQHQLVRHRLQQQTMMHRMSNDPMYNQSAQFAMQQQGNAPFSEIGFALSGLRILV